MEIKIFIQQTEDGARVVYPMGFNEFSSENNQYQFFLKDEAHKADYADAYCLQISKNFKVYSLISSEIKDYLGRSGSFFAIRLVVPKQKSIDGVESLLNNIKDRYKKHYEDKAMSTLNFQDLTDAIVDSTLNNSNNTISYGIDKEAFIFKDTSTSLNTIFNNDAINLIKCLYVFNKDKTDKVIFERMLPFSDVINISRRIQVVSNGLLQALKVNGIEIDYPNNSNSFELLTTTDSIVTYKKIDEKEFNTEYGNSISLSRKYVAPTIHKESKKPIGQILIYTFLSVGIVSLLVWISLDFFKPTSTEPANMIQTQAPQIINKTKNTNEVKFDIISKNKDEKRYKVIVPKGLENFEFIYNSGWSYDNTSTPTGSVDFSENILDEIFKNANVNCNDTIKQNFISELEKISDEKISKKPVENIKPEVNKVAKPKSTAKAVKIPAKKVETKKTTGKNSSKDDDQIGDK